MEHQPNTEPMRGARRIDGQKYHIERLTDEELANIGGYLRSKHVTLVADIAFVETVLFERGHDQLPFDDEVDLNGYAEADVVHINRWDDQGNYTNPPDAA